MKENIYSEEKVELKQNGLESIWVKIPTPDSANYICDHINHSIDVAMNTNIDRMVICGDFNEDQLNSRKIQI